MTFFNSFFSAACLIFFLLMINTCSLKKEAATVTPTAQVKKKKRKRPITPFIDGNKEITDTLLQTKHFQFISHYSPITKEQIQQLAEQCEATVVAIQRFTNSTITIPKINYHLYASVEQKALRQQGMEIASIEASKNNNHVVVNQHFQGSLLHQEHKLILQQLLGTPQLPALEEGLSNHFTKKWQRKGYQYWCGKLFRSNNLPPLQELLDATIFKKESPLVMGAMAGVFVDFLLEQFGKAEFLQNYRTWMATDLNQLEAQWYSFLAQQYENTASTAHEPTSLKKSTYWQGFNFAHEGYQIFNGYGSQLAKESIEQLARIGSSAIAIVPYSFMRDPTKPSNLLIKHRAGGETDESVLFAHFEAQALGMHTMLKPQIWIRRSWPGDVNMSSEKDWQQFFEEYYRWARHYALLAEINGFDSFCIGVEFAKATLAKEQEWRKLIGQIRGIYSGQLTYAANWGEEFEQLQFWDALDFIGLNCYYPLSPKENPSKRDLKKAFKNVIAKIEKVHRKYDKPIVFTEIGFRSVTATWKNPHEDDQGRPFDEQCQALAYEVIFEGIRDKDWCQGIFWWKWPSYLDYQGAQNTSFIPTNKRAEEVVTTWFKK